jgi:putative membrane protein
VADFSRDRNRHSQKFFRIVNEIPTVLMIAIVLLAVVKPF